MRILTVRQPWAHAIIHGGKDVENRVRNIAGGYRGPVAIHAAMAWDDLASDNPSWETLADAMEAHPDDWDDVRGAIIGVVDLVDVHTADDTQQTKNRRGLWPTCSPWAERTGWHLVLGNPRPLALPIEYRGALGLRKLDAETIARIEAAIV